MKMKMEQTCGRNNQRMKMRVEEIRKKTRKRDGKIVKERKEATGKRKNNQNCWCITEKGLEGVLSYSSIPLFLGPPALLWPSTWNHLKPPAWLLASGLCCLHTFPAVCTWWVQSVQSSYKSTTPLLSPLRHRQELAGLIWEEEEEEASLVLFISFAFFPFSSSVLRSPFLSHLACWLVCGSIFRPSPGRDVHFSPLSFKPLTNHWLPASPPLLCI